jgi:hypothetical protein
MGIRFFCPKGHKLNVKEFLAGKRAICPYCGLKVLVPMESTRVSSRRQKGDAQTQSAIQGMSSLSSSGAVAGGVSAPDVSDAAVVSSGSSIIIAGASGFADASDASATEAAEGGAFSDSVSDMLTQMSAAAPGPNGASAGSSDVLAESGDAAPGVENPLAELNDPLAGAENVLWYVRPASGGQLGPAPSDILRHWLAKGRVKADSFVWRDGWSDWQLAGNVFPQFASSLSKPNLSGLLAEEQAAASSPQTDLEELLRPHPRKMQTAAIVILAVVILTLVATLATVLIVNL